MRIHFQQSGGVAGLRRPPVTVDTDSLPPHEAGEWTGLVAAADVFNLPPSSPAGPGADRSQYQVSVETEGRQHTITVFDGAIPAALRPLIDRLRQAGRAAFGP
jgi:hypothetical protein